MSTALSIGYKISVRWVTFVISHVGNISYEHNSVLMASLKFRVSTFINLGVAGMDVGKVERP